MKKDLKGIENPKQIINDIGEKINNIYEINLTNNYILTSFNQYGMCMAKACGATHVRIHILSTNYTLLVSLSGVLKIKDYFEN